MESSTEFGQQAFQVVKRIKQEYSQAFIMQPSQCHKEDSDGMAYISLAPPGAHQTFNEE